jgi:hypothetical protein
MYIRNFVSSGAFDKLMESDDFKICLSEITEEMRGMIPKEKIAAEFTRNSRNIKLVYKFNKLCIRALRKRSATFDIKARTGWPFGRYGIASRVASSQPFFNAVTKKIAPRMFKPNPSVEKIVAKHRPDLVIFPYTGVESTGIELIRLSKKYNFKTYFLVNGWDNLSSKGILPMTPDFLGIWGPQSVADAVNIHGMKSHRVILLGCARYEDYFNPDNSKNEIFPHKYILFAGSTVPNDEITPLKLFDEALEEAGANGVKVIYRPHPWREKRNCPDTFEPESFKHVIIDPQVADLYYGEKRKGTESSASQNFPALSYYPSLVNHALFLASPMSSMTLEAALFDVPCMILAHDDGCHKIPGSLQAKYKHFEGGDEVPGWFYVRSLDEIKPMFKKMLSMLRNDNSDARAFRPVLSEAMRKYIYCDNRSYAERLEASATTILCSNLEGRTGIPPSAIGAPLSRKGSEKVSASEDTGFSFRMIHSGVFNEESSWGAENFLCEAFRETGLETRTLDYRANRHRIYKNIIKAPPFDALFLQRGDFFPLQVVRSLKTPKLFWDTELPYQYWDHEHLIKGNPFDHYFFYTESTIDYYVGKCGLDRSRSSVLGGAFEPSIHRPLENVKKDIDVLFVGSSTPRRRAVFAELEKKSHDFKLVVTSAHKEEMIELINRARIVLNVHATDFATVETRVYEVLGCGSFLLTEKLPADNPFTDNDFAQFDGVDDLVEKIARYLNNPGQMEEMAAHGRKAALDGHTYYHRALYVAQIMKRLVDERKSDGGDKSRADLGLLAFAATEPVLRLGWSAKQRTRAAAKKLKKSIARK